jgi:hexulose-6-phosphate isomerase
MEVPAIKDADQAKQMRAAGERTGTPIHSVIYGGWHLPLSHPDPATRDKGVADVEAALESAERMGADNILLVPAIVNAETRYEQAYERSQQAVQRLVSVAEKRRVQILIEPVWNNFLLSPREFNQYVDSFGSPWVQAYFDVGNVMAFAWPQDWIRTLGKRIQKLHVKDFKGGPGLGGSVGKGQWVNLGDGSIDWPEIVRALDEIGYRNFVTVELGGGDADYLRDISARMDRVLGLMPESGK